MEKGGLEEEKRRVYSEAEFGAGASTSGKHSKKGGGGGGGIDFYISMYGSWLILILG